MKTYRYVDQKTMNERMVTALETGLGRKLTKLEARKIEWLSGSESETTGVLLDLFKELSGRSTEEPVTTNVDDLKVSFVQMPDDETFAYGIFKIKGLSKVLFRFQYFDGKTVRVENQGSVFLLDSETSSTGKEIDLKLSQEEVEKYERDIQFMIENNMVQ
ncbi:hypothetical protein J2S74_005421 [Evansella vedderi]|uniref:Uncharacterized protein n=1 Tax=Evansella vedderi TaxID=38282 RepID=A0ABU0A383_9BACI|nr:hypothetical protein [Evansella vedderi]MDQ0257958.1 hypothetical protein [Evansella vedderi]